MHTRTLEKLNKNRLSKSQNFHILHGEMKIPKHIWWLKGFILADVCLSDLELPRNLWFYFNVFDTPGEIF